MSELKPASKRFLVTAKVLGLEANVQQLALSSRTAEDAAAACGCNVGQIVKSLVFRGAETGQAILLLVSGCNRVDQDGVAEQIGEPLVRPDAHYVREATGYAIGGIPPIGHKVRLDTYMDKDLMTYETIWAAAGTPYSVFSTTPTALREAASATIIALTRRKACRPDHR